MTEHDLHGDVPDGSLPDPRAAGARIETLLEASSSGGPLVRERAEQLVAAVVELYGAGLGRILDLLGELGHLDDDVAKAFAADDLVASLLLVHGLHPYPVDERIEHALDDVRPYLQAHGGDVELLDMSGDEVTLRMVANGHGCASSPVTLESAVRAAVETAAPDVQQIRVDSIASSPTVISVESLFRPPAVAR
jgi:Fe-S cluster biogenesis protein NfuA